ncbi:unnamed protein product, partial [Effrenium voratum]
MGARMKSRPSQVPKTRSRGCSGSELQKAKEELTRIKIGTTENLSQAGLRASETFPRKGTPALKTLNGPGSLAFWRGELQGARQFLFQIRHQRLPPSPAKREGHCKGLPEAKRRLTSNLARLL